ncbi:hypothetical protein BGZ95_005827 [Linnemannia exigua]|uniref:Uncharacterized protein n=1 Tax=Linnemannia exigua TaxID=604196 RepID=A0AAD4DLG6_9FUNG|nr:hypothetical protein BGZ95_005827 [Linnemannia exigua]
MTPAPSSSRNRRSATLTNIPPPPGPPPTPPAGHPGTYIHTTLGHSQSVSNHSTHSSFSSHSGPINSSNNYSTAPSSYAPPRASFSSSPRASPVGGPSGRSGRDKDQDAWNDSAWRSIFDAALVKAQQAVQLDELQETTLAANLYAQAANDLGRVIPMCSSEKKKQSMLSISNDGHNYRYSVINRNSGYAEDQYQPQQYQPQQYQLAQQVPQQQRYQQSMQQQQQQQQQHFQSPVLSPVLSPAQHYQTPQFQLQQNQEPPQQPQQQQSSGLRLFGKKRSKTQPSVSQPPPEFAKQFQSQGQDYNNFNHNNQSSNDNNRFGYDDYSEQAEAYTVPFVAPPKSPNPAPAVPSIFMSQPPVSTSNKGQQNGTSAAPAPAPAVVQEQPTKSSKWRPFGKKKSKSLSHPETSTAFTPPPEMAPSVPVFTPHIEPEPQYHDQQQQQQQVEEVVEYKEEEFKNPVQGDWYVESTPGEDSYEYDEFENPAHYFGEEDEDVDPYYIADTKGRAKAFEGQDTGPNDKDKSASTKESEANFSPKFDFSQSEQTTGFQAQLAGDEPISDDRAHASNFTDNVDVNNDDMANGNHHNVQGSHYQEASDSIALSQIEGEEMARSMLEPAGNDHDGETVATGDAVVEKTKTKRTWYGKKKKEKDPEREKEKQKQKELDRLDTVARLMDDALFGASPKSKLDKDKLKEKPSVASLDKPISHHSNDHSDQAHQTSTTGPAPVLPEVNFSESHISTSQDKDDIVTTDKNKSTIEEPYVLPAISEPTNIPAISEPANIPEISEPTNSESGITTTTAGHDAPSIASDTPKRSKSRHFSIFKSKKNKEMDTQQPIAEGTPLSPTVTNDDSKSMHSQHTRKSSFSADRKVESPVVIVRPKEKEVKKRDSDEYVPYVYQEELEGPLMERVEVPENREVIGFVLPVEEVIDYTLEGNEEAALENWDSWVSQLESFEKVLSDKGLKKEKAKKAKKVKEEKPAKDEHPLAPMGSNKANRSSIFGSLGRSDTIKSRNNTALDLNAHALDNRPLSMSTTLLDDISTRPSFQSSRSGESEAPSQFLVAPQTRKRWWKRKDTNSFYRASNALSMADLEQDQHLSALLRSQSQVRSSDNLPLEHSTPLMSMPISLVDTPVAPIKEVSKEAPAVMESVPAPEAVVKEQEPKETAPKVEMKIETKIETKVEQPGDDEEEEEAESEVVIAPMPKPKVKSSKPKLGEKPVIATPAPAPTFTPVAPAPAPVPVPTYAPAAVVRPVEEGDDEDEEIENYAAHRRRNTISRSSTTPDKYSKYKTTNKTTTVINNTNVASSQAIATEDNADAKSVSSTKTVATTTSESDTTGRLGPEVSLEQMLESKNVDHVKYYIQRMKTDTVTKARNGSKFAALEGMKNVKVLQKHLADLLDPKSEDEEEEEEKDQTKLSSSSSVPAPDEERMITVQPTIQEEDEEEDEEDEKATTTQAPPTKDTKEEIKAPTEKEE